MAQPWLDDDPCISTPATCVVTAILDHASAFPPLRGDRSSTVRAFASVSCGEAAAFLLVD